MSTQPAPAAQKFRKKPVVIEAIQYAYVDVMDLTPFTFRGTIPDWLQLAIAENKIVPVRGNEDYWYLEIPTLEGAMRMGPDDWLIRGIKGELYPCKPDIFTSTYEPI